jgi:hypothetical protein
MRVPDGRRAGGLGRHSRAGQRRGLCVDPRSQSRPVCSGPCQPRLGGRHALSEVTRALGHISAM